MKYNKKVFLNPKSNLSSVIIIKNKKLVLKSMIKINTKVIYFL